MTPGNKSNKGYESTPDSFERSLALYRSRVHELYFSAHQSGGEILGPLALRRSESPKPTILVVEDNADEWFLIRWALLQVFPKVDIVWLSNPSEVLSYMDEGYRGEAELPRFILVDLYLPTAKIGLTLLQNLKSHPIYQHIPIVTVSRSNDPSDIADAFKHDSNSYIVKPTTYNEWREGFSMLHSYWHEPLQK